MVLGHSGHSNVNSFVFYFEYITNIISYWYGKNIVEYALKYVIIR